MKAKQLQDLGEYLRNAIRYLESAADIVDDQFEKAETIETSCRGGQRPIIEDIGQPIMGSKVA